MTRKKVKLAFITNDSARKATFKKRKKGLMKKVSELSTLCGIDACAILYSPYETAPEVWPNTVGVQRVLTQFKRMPEMEQSKKMVNQESFIRQRIAKASDQLSKQHKDNREKEITEVMYQCLTGKGLQNLMLPDLNDLGWLVDQKLKEINKRIEFLKKNGNAPPPASVAPPLASVAPPPASVAPPPPVPHVVVAEQKLAMDFAAMEGTSQRPQWFTEWMNNGNENGFGHGEDMMMPFGDPNNGNMWSSNFFP